MTESLAAVSGRPMAAPSSSFPPLPASARTRDGQIIVPSDDEWILMTRAEGGSRFKFPWSTLSGLTPRMVHITKAIIANHAVSKATKTLRNEYDSVRCLGEWYATLPNADPRGLDWSAVTASLGQAFRDYGVAQTANAGNDFSRIRTLYREGVGLFGEPDFANQTLLELETINAPGNAKGNAVRNGDSEAGYFTPPEVDLMLDALARGVGTPEQRASAWLCLEAGRNTTQFVLLTNADLRWADSLDNEGRSVRLYQIMVRRMKKRTLLDAKVPYPISTPLGDFLLTLQRGGPNDYLLWWLMGHDARLTRCLRQWARQARLVSPRTNKPMHLTPRRFRVTMLTNAADEGASAEHLAVMADHTDLQNVMVYIDRSPVFLLRIRDKVDAIYAPHVTRFKGRIANRSEDTGAPVIPGVAPHLPLLNLGGIGRCGNKEICKLAPPLTCYDCDKFIAFRDGPHEQVVVALERSMRTMGDRIALQIARPLAAAREVVNLIRTEQAGERHEQQ